MTDASAPIKHSRVGGNYIIFYAQFINIKPKPNQTKPNQTKPNQTKQ
jgi:hypothetical protein